MRKHVVAFALLAAGCGQEHTVRLELGDGAGNITQGFLCRTEVALPGLAAGDYLFERGHDLASGAVTFSLAVDVVSLGRVLPGCLPEELLGVCRNGACGVAARACEQVSVRGPRGKPLAAMTDSERTAFLAEVGGALRGLPPLFRDAPDGPVVLRAVLSTQPCAELLASEAFGIESLMGCAYSCPAVLDNLDGSLRLGFATSDELCAPEVRACAAYPNR